jgi:hypothetical protein
MLTNSLRRATSFTAWNVLGSGIDHFHRPRHLHPNETYFARQNAEEPRIQDGC